MSNEYRCQNCGYQWIGWNDTRCPNCNLSLSAFVDDGGLDIETEALRSDLRARIQTLRARYGDYSDVIKIVVKNEIRKFLANV